MSRLNILRTYSPEAKRERRKSQKMLDVEEAERERRGGETVANKRHKQVTIV